MFLFEEKSRIKELVEEFLKKAGFSGFVDVLKEENAFLIRIKSDEPKILIGKNGQTLMEIQHLLRIILKKKAGEEFSVDLDVNDYKKKKNDYLKDTARTMADEVFLSKQEKALEPMPAYERRIIHMELANRSDVKTESIGEGEERRIVIKPR